MCVVRISTFKIADFKFFEFFHRVGYEKRGGFEANWDPEASGFGPRPLDSVD